MISSKLRISEETVSYYEYGDKKNPSIVCLHGLAANGLYCFGELIPYLKKNYHLIILDSPGHGKTSSFSKEEDYLFSNLAKWVYKVSKEIIQKPFYILGHSWGADVALHFTRFYPEEVLGLILLDGGFTFPHNQPEMTFDYVYSGWNNYMEQSVFENKEKIFQEYKTYTIQWNSRKEQYAVSLFNKRHDEKFELVVSKLTVLAIIKAFFKEPFMNTYPFIKAPVLLIHAAHPENLKSARAIGILQLRNNIEDVEIKMLEDSSHMVQWDEPEHTAVTIINWINKKYNFLKLDINFKK